MKKLITFGILILFVFSCFLPLVTGSLLEKQNYVSRDIITVDDDGDGDYTSIKDAVNNANPGDTIEVYSGTYYECGIEIHTKNVTLKGIPYELGNGSDTGKPFIDGEGKDFVIGYMVVEGVLVTNFRMENGGGTSHCIITIYKSKNCIFSNNDINNAVTGLIYSKDSINIKILRNNISQCPIRQGINFHNCSSFTISDNIITDVETGICVWESNNNTIIGNKIMRCSDFGIDVAGSFNKIIGNHIEDNAIGVQIWNFFNSVKNNNFINNGLHAQFIYGIPLLQRLSNRWFGNYWDEPRLLPYPILGLLVLLPTIQFDWHPALKPYDISGGDLPAGNQEEQTNQHSQQNSLPVTKTKSSTGSICITVKSAQYKTPFSGACVVAYNLETKDWYYILPDVNKMGVYINNNFPVGKYFIGAGKEGYIIDGTTVTIEENQQTTHTFYLRPEPPNGYSNDEQVAVSTETELEQFSQQSSSQQISQQSSDQLILKLFQRNVN